MITPQPRHEEAMRNYQPKGLLHAPRFTTKPRDCNVCRKPLPIPHPTSKRTCDACLSDPVRREQQRQKENKRERDRYVSKRQPIVPVMRTCQHREEKNGPVCGIKFEAKPRIDGKGLNRGVHADQVYCPKHQTPKAVARRRWLNRNVENYKRLQRAYRHRNLAKVRMKQRDRARRQRDELAALRAKKQPADWYQKPLRWRVIADVLRSQDAPVSNSEVGKQLDDGEILKPYTDGNWEAVLSSSIHPAVKLLSKVRKWVNRPGKTAVEK